MKVVNPTYAGGGGHVLAFRENLADVTSAKLATSKIDSLKKTLDKTIWRIESMLDGDRS